VFVLDSSASQTHLHGEELARWGVDLDSVHREATHALWEASRTLPLVAKPPADPTLTGKFIALASGDGNDAARLAVPEMREPSGASWGILSMRPFRTVTSWWPGRKTTRYRRVSRPRRAKMFTRPKDMAMPPMWFYYIQVASLDDALERANSKGARVLNGPMEVPGGARIAQLTNPQGASFALHEEAKKAKKA
jgi:hypothetical protein